MTLPQLMVAPNGATKGKSDHPAVPVAIDEIVETAVACVKAGADGIHAHVRDSAGTHVLDPGLYQELLAELQRSIPRLYVQITTEAVGRYSAAEQAELVYAVKPSAVSVALREMTRAPEADVRRFYHWCEEALVEVQHILYDAEDVSRLAVLRAQKVVPDQPFMVLYVLGRYSAGQVAVESDLGPFLARQSAELGTLDWAVCAFGVNETRCLQHASMLGGKLRVGFENNLWNADGSRAADNADRVREVFAATHTRQVVGGAAIRS